MRKTRIIGTIGPASQDMEVLKKLIQGGVDVIRINLSHANLAFCDEIIDKIRKLEKELTKPIGIMLDLDGPSARVHKFIENEVIVEKDREIKLYNYPVVCNNTQISLSCDNVLESINVGDELLFSDGVVSFVVKEKQQDIAVLKTVTGGVIKSNTSVHIKGKSFKMPFISSKDYESIMYALKKNIDFLALSYVRSEQDVLEVADLLIANGNNHVGIISKIENRTALENLDEIIKVSDGVMVARGDLALETAIERLPYFQKLILSKASEYGKISIVATDFLLSMEENDHPTRPEVSDIYNAVMDFTDAILLSGETTIGKYPIEAVETLNKVIISAEEDLSNEEHDIPLSNDITSTIASAVTTSANRLNAKAIITNTNSGYTALLISRSRSSSPILALSPNIDTVRSLTLAYGITSQLVNECKSTDTIVNMCTKKARELFSLQDGDIVIITGGFPIESKNTNFMKIEVL